MNDDSIVIKPLSERRSYAPILAHWSCMEWYRKRDVPFEAILASYMKRTDLDRIPLSFVATVGTVPAGMASLKNDDLWSRKDLNPWLSSLYVVPEYRSLGVGGMLCNAVVAKARELKLGAIHLFLGQHEKERLKEFYIKRSWQFYDFAVDNDGIDTEIYILHLS